MSHQIPAIIGCNWDSNGHFLYHFLPTIIGHGQREGTAMNRELQRYFEFAANLWLEFAPGELKDKFPRNFRFPVTIPYLFTDELPKELKAVPQLEVLIESFSREGVDAEVDKNNEGY
jgi:hypothetical protein